MTKSCCAVGCSNRYRKGSGISFSRFPSKKKNEELHKKWVAALRRADWEPDDHAWICSVHFVGGKRSTDPLSPAYLPQLFEHVRTPRKRQLERQFAAHNRRLDVAKKRLSLNPVPLTQSPRLKPVEPAGKDEELVEFACSDHEMEIEPSLPDVPSDVDSRQSCETVRL